MRTILGEAPLVAVDVGARGDIQPTWLVLDGIARVISFEPDAEASRRLEEAYARRGHGHLYRVLPLALSGAGGKRTLYVTNTPSGSSLLPPNPEICDGYVDNHYLYPLKEVEIDTRSLADVLGEIGEPEVHLLKLDVQGCELEILDGLGAGRVPHLASVQMEMMMWEQYRGQPPFCQGHTWFLDHGFDLFDARVIRSQRARNGDGEGYQRDVFGVYGDSPSIAARVAELDVTYFRRLDDVLRTGDPRAVRRLAVAYSTHAFFAEAHHLIERARDLRVLAPDEAERCLAAIVEWHRGLHYRTKFQPTRFWKVTRLASKALLMSDEIVHELARGDAKAVLRKIYQRAGEALID